MAGKPDPHWIAIPFATATINPPMDENDPENFFQLLKYLNREQYGDRPLAFGQFWDTPLDLEKQYNDGLITIFLMEQ